MVTSSAIANYSDKILSLSTLAISRMTQADCFGSVLYFTNFGGCQVS